MSSMWLNDSTENVSRHWVNMCVVNIRNASTHMNGFPNIATEDHVHVCNG